VTPLLQFFFHIPYLSNCHPNAQNPSLITTPQKTGLSQRANHPREQLKLLHGSLFDIKCFKCTYVQQNNYDDPLDPILAIDSPSDDRLATSKTSIAARAAYLDPATPPTIAPADLPHCPSCKTGLLRPGVVWFGEELPADTLREVQTFIDQGPIDLIMVIGTTATVYPAAGYVARARAKGAKVALVNMDAAELGAIGTLNKGDFLFVGDAAKILPEILKPVIGELKL
jgi:NAD-dependent SIR2 family protein deacetylase